MWNLVIIHRIILIIMVLSIGISIMIFYNGFNNQALALDSNDTSALVDTGIHLANSGNFTGAITYFNKSLAIDPNDTDTLVNIGLDLDELGDTTGAITYYDKALAIDPNNTIALVSKGADIAHL